MKKILSVSLAIMLLLINVPTTAQAATSTITYLTKAVYDDVGTYSDGLVLVSDGNNRKYLNEKGKVVIDLSV